MKLKLSIDTGEGPYQVTTSLYDVVQWERKMKRKASQLAEGIGAEDLAYLGYLATRSAGITVPVSFDDFLRKIETLEVIEDQPDFPTVEATDTN